jgi:antitoxin PrlF
VITRDEKAGVQVGELGRNVRRYAGSVHDPNETIADLREAVPERSECDHDDLSRRLDRCGRNSYHVGMKSVVSEKGQVTIPKPLREKLGLRPGQVLEFETRDGVLVGRKAAAQENPVDAVRGVLNRMSVDAEIVKMRGKPWNAADDRPRAKRR